MTSLDERLMTFGLRSTKDLTEKHGVEENLAKGIALISQDSMILAMEASDRRYKEARAESDERFELARAESDRRFANFRSEMLQRFDQVDARFNKVDARFDKVDARFDKVDDRLNRVDLKFDSLTERVATLESNFKAFRPRILIAIGSTLIVAATTIAKFDEVLAFLSTLGS